MQFSRGLVLFTAAGAGIFIFLSVLVARQQVFCSNDGSRWATVWSLTHGRGYIIDDSPYGTNDKVFMDGHFYSSKPALLPTLLAGIVFLFTTVSGLALPQSDQVIIPFVLLIINVVPFMLWIYLYGNWLRSGEYTAFTKIICLYNAAFGTYLTAYSISLNNHTVAALASGFALILFLRILRADSATPLQFFGCGIFSSWTVANELPSGFFCIFLFVCLFKNNQRNACLFFLPGAILISLLFFVTTCIATHSLIPFYLKPQLYHYPNSYWNNPRGMDAATDPLPLYLFNHLLGHHGIFSLTPMFVFAAIGAFWRTSFRSISFGATLLTIINCIFVTKVTKNYGGLCQGPRWFFWLIPLWLFCLPVGVDRFQSRAWRLAICFALIWSTGSVIYAIFSDPKGPWSVSWLQQWMEALGLVSY